ncbi:MAG TPA: hypothetical protein VN663_09680 [Ramlibacter sp.]|nr:hypothetical protein [Ramlibacter sp.]
MREYGTAISGFSRRRVQPLVSVIALAVAGCQFPWALDDGAARGGNAPREREQAMNARWKNHSYSELVGALGPPLQLLNIPGGGNPPGFAAVYGRDPASGCIDSFALVYGSDPMIRVYYCR